MQHPFNFKPNTIPKTNNKYQEYVGKRIKLVFTSDQYTELRPGDVGTVMFIDDINNIHIDWDNGSRLSLIPNIDKFEIFEK